MNRIDRALGILLLLRDGESISAADLARRFEVSTRTIYRDVESLSQVGVPVYAERGREGGFRLVPGYFLPPIMFSQSEAVSLLLAVTMLRNLRARPFAAELQLAEEKLLAAMPRKLRQTLAAARRVIGTEAAPRDSFHPEPQDAPPADGGDEPEAAARESHVVSVFLQAILDRRMLALDYHSPYRGQTDRMRVAPLGIFWDRDRWYLVGRPDDAAGKAPRRLWRADRVRDIRPLLLLVDGDPAFDVRDELGRRWLRAAMAAWAREAPVRIDVSHEQQARLQADWYYQHAEFAPLADGRVLVTFGEDNPAVVFALLRWLGPGAVLVEPAAWRAAFKAELLRMAATYDSD